MRGRAGQTVIFDGQEYPLAKACLKARLNYESVRHRAYYRNITAQESFDHFFAEKQSKLKTSPNKIGAGAYDKHAPNRTPKKT